MTDKITIERETLDITPIGSMCAILKDHLIVASEYTDCTILYRVTFDQLRALFDHGRSNGRAALAAQPAPAAVPLTDGDCIALMLHLNAELRQTDSPTQMFIAIARAVERAHGIAAARDKP